MKILKFAALALVLLFISVIGFYLVSDYYQNHILISQYNKTDTNRVIAELTRRDLQKAHEKPVPNTVVLQFAQQLTENMCVDQPTIRDQNNCYTVTQERKAVCEKVVKAQFPENIDDYAAIKTIQKMFIQCVTPISADVTHYVDPIMYQLIAEVKQRPLTNEAIMELANEVAINLCKDVPNAFNGDIEACTYTVMAKRQQCEASLASDKTQTINNSEQAGKLVADYWDCVLPAHHTSLVKQAKIQALKQMLGFIILDKATRWGLRQ